MVVSCWSMSSSIGVDDPDGARQWHVRRRWRRLTPLDPPAGSGARAARHSKDTPTTCVLAFATDAPGRRALYTARWRHRSMGHHRDHQLSGVAGTRIDGCLAPGQGATVTVAMTRDSDAGANDGGGPSGRAIRSRDHRRWSGRLWRCALRRVGRTERRHRRERHDGRHVPEPWLHPGQGVPRDGRGTPPRGPRRRVRHRVQRADGQLRRRPRPASRSSSTASSTASSG